MHHEYRSRRRHDTRIQAIQKLRDDLVEVIEHTVRVQIIQYFHRGQTSPDGRTTFVEVPTVVAPKVPHVAEDLAVHHSIAQFMQEDLHNTGTAYAVARQHVSPVTADAVRGLHRKRNVVTHEPLRCTHPGQADWSYPVWRQVESELHAMKIREPAASTAVDMDTAVWELLSDSVMPPVVSGAIVHCESSEPVVWDGCPLHDVLRQRRHAAQRRLQQIVPVDSSDGTLARGLHAVEELTERSDADMYAENAVYLTADSPAELLGAPRLATHHPPLHDAWRRLDSIPGADISHLTNVAHWAWFRSDCTGLPDQPVQIIRRGDKDYSSQVRVRRPGEPRAWSSGCWVPLASVIAQPAVLRTDQQ